MALHNSVCSLERPPHHYELFGEAGVEKGKSNVVRNGFIICRTRKGLRKDKVLDPIETVRYGRRK